MASRGERRGSGEGCRRVADEDGTLVHSTAPVGQTFRLREEEIVMGRMKAVENGYVPSGQQQHPTLLWSTTPRPPRPTLFPYTTLFRSPPRETTLAARR